jgi:hypothetical protein
LKEHAEDGFWPGDLLPGEPPHGDRRLHDRRYSAIVIKYWRLARIRFFNPTNDAATRQSVAHYVRTLM